MMGERSASVGMKLRDHLGLMRRGDARACACAMREDFMVMAEALRCVSLGLLMMAMARASVVGAGWVTIRRMRGPPEGFEGNVYVVVRLG